MVWLNVITLLAIISISLVTVFYEGYKDSLAERIGASIIGTWAVAHIATPTNPSTDLLILQVGLVFRGFAITLRAVRHGHRVWRR